MKNTIHPINESHLGTDGTPDQARRMAEILTAMGYPSQYCGAQGIRTSLLDPETGEEIEIPDDVWNNALHALVMGSIA